MDPKDPTDSAAEGSDEGSSEPVRALIMTKEAHAYYTEDGKLHGRFPFRMYVPMYRLVALYKALCAMVETTGKPADLLTLDELKLLVCHDGAMTKCVRCGDKFQPVKGVELRNLCDDRVVKDILSGKSRKASEEIYGRLAPFIATLPDGKAMEFGSYIKVPILEDAGNGRKRIVGWNEPQPHNGPIFWWISSRDMVVRNNKHCLGKAMIASDVAGFGGNCYSYEAALASIAYSEAKHEQNLKEGQAVSEKRDELDMKTASMFGIVVVTTDRGNRIFSRDTSRGTKTTPPTPADDKVDRSGKRRFQ